VKTVLDLPDEILKSARESAAIRGETLGDYVAAAVQARLRDESTRESTEGGWQGVFGAARHADVAAIDEIVSRDLERVELDDWR
jgi:hypothetical protein